jgi:hypothetical protein
MDRRCILSLGARALVAAIAVLGCACSTTWTPFQGSILNPAQLFSESTDVRGVRVNVLYGKNARVDGLDVGGANRVEDGVRGLQLAWLVNVAGELDGVQIGLGYNVTEGRARGLQALSGVNHARELYGLQLLGFNYSRSVVGAQIGPANQAEDHLTGLQLSLINHAGSINGLQIGGWHNRSGPVNGVQIGGLVNQATELVGVQIGGLGNEAKGLVGLQIGGLVNRAEGLVGLQIGLLNFNKGGLLPVFPLVNFGFGQ